MPSDKTFYKTVFDDILKEARACRTIMVIGGPDAGKSTFAMALASRLNSSTPAAMVDLDTGQSTIGPPSTVAWGLFDPSGEKGEIRAGGLYFTGAFSPAGNLLPSVVGAARMLEGAFRRAGRVIIDTSGLVSEPAGRVLKQYKIEALRPDMVVAIERKDELEGILEPLARLERPLVIRIKPSKLARQRSRAERVAYRLERFSRYFGGARRLEINLRGRTLFTREKTPLTEKTLFGRLVALRDSFDCDMALGVVEGAVKKSVLIRTPLEDAAKVSLVVIGSSGARLPEDFLSGL